MLINGTIKLEKENELKILEKIIDTYNNAIVKLYDSNGGLISQSTAINVYSKLELINIDLSTPLYTQTISIKMNNIEHILIKKYDLVADNSNSILYIDIILKNESEEKIKC